MYDKWSSAVQPRELSDRLVVGAKGKDISRRNNFGSKNAAEARSLIQGQPPSISEQSGEQGDVETDL